MTVAKGCECRLGIGQVTISLTCPSPQYADSMRDYFGGGVVDREPDLTLQLEILPHDDRSGVPNSLFATKRLRNGEFDVDHGLASGFFDPERRTGVLRVQHVLTKEPLTRVFEQLLYQAFYSAARLRDYPSVLMHSSGVIRHGAGYLFVGESGAGKSTVAELSGRGEGRVLNDEICLLEFGPDTTILHGTPFNGLFRKKTAGQAPLRAVFLLAHGSEHRIEAVSPGLALQLLTRQVVAPLPLEQELAPATSGLMLDHAARLLQSAPTRRLLFAPDAGFWPVILKEFPPEEGTE